MMTYCIVNISILLSSATFRLYTVYVNRKWICLCADNDGSVDEENAGDVIN